MKVTVKVPITNARGEKSVELEADLDTGEVRLVTPAVPLYPRVALAHLQQAVTDLTEAARRREDPSG